MIYYKFTIDGTVISEPGNIKGWERLTTSIKRATDLKALLITQDAELTFIGSMYAFFYDKFYNSGVCTEIETLIEQSTDNQNFISIHRGKIQIKDIQLEETLGEAKAKIIDDSYFARIGNNKNIGTVPDSGRSKNDHAILPCPVYEIDVFDVVTDGSLGNRQGFFAYDVMRYLVDFMSDGEVGFESDFLLTELPLMITNGFALRTPGSLSAPNWSTSFEDLIKNLRGCRDISFGIEYDNNGKPILRLERNEYFYQDTVSFRFTNPLKIRSYVDVQSLYSKVKFGSTITNDSPVLHFLENTIYNGFREEEFHVLGQCNIDKELNLVRDYIVSSNVIEYIIDQTGLGSPDTGHDEDIVLIHVENVNRTALTANAVSTQFTAAGDYYYNLAINNAQAGKDYFTTFQGDLAQFLNIISNDLLASSSQQYLYSTSGTVPTIPINLPPVNVTLDFGTEFDPGGNFNLGTDTYIVPISGYYTLSLYALFDVFSLGQQFDMNVSFGFNGNINAAGLFQAFAIQADHFGIVANVSGSVYLDAGDAITASVLMDAVTAGSSEPVNPSVELIAFNWSITNTPVAGGVVQTYDPSKIRNIFHEIEYHLTPSQFDLIANLKRDPLNLNYRNRYEIYWTEKNRVHSGHIESIKYDHKKERANIILKSSLDVARNDQAKLPAYRFTFDMLASTDEIWSFLYNSGGDVTASNIGLITQLSVITAAIEASLTGAVPAITFDRVEVTRVLIGTLLYRYTITIVDPNYDITIIDISGTSYVSQFIYI